MINTLLVYKNIQFQVEYLKNKKKLFFLVVDGVSNRYLSQSVAEKELVDIITKDLEDNVKYKFRTALHKEFNKIIMLSLK